MVKIVINKKSVFDLGIEEILKKMLKKAHKKFKNRNWTIRTTFWEDGDYNISLESGYGKYRDIFIYKKSDGKIIYQKKKVGNEVIIF